MEAAGPMRRGTKLERLVAIAALSTTVWLTGCATAKVAGDEERQAREASRKQAESACVRAALTASDSGQLLMPYVVDRDVYARCMEARGYPAATR